MPNDFLRIRDRLTHCEELKLLYRVSNDPITFGRAKRESAVRYFRIQVKYAP